MKNETGVVAIIEFVGLVPKIYSFSVDESCEHKKTKGLNKSVVAIIVQGKYKNVLLNKKYSRHSMNRIQSEGHRIETNEINRNYLPCFADKVFILNNGYDWLALGYQSYIKNSYLNLNLGGLFRGLFWGGGGGEWGEG